MDKKDTYLWLLSIGGIGNKTIEKIEYSVSNIEELIDFSDKDILKLENINLNIISLVVHYLEQFVIKDLYHGMMIWILQCQEKILNNF